MMLLGVYELAGWWGLLTALGATLLLFGTLSKRPVLEGQQGRGIVEAPHRRASYGGRHSEVVQRAKGLLFHSEAHPQFGAEPILAVGKRATVVAMNNRETPPDDLEAFLGEARHDNRLRTSWTRKTGTRGSMKAHRTRGCHASAQGGGEVCSPGGSDCLSAPQKTTAFQLTLLVGFATSGKII